MSIVYAIIVSIIIKGISAIVEIAIQLIIANGVGVAGFGDYTFFVSVIEFAFFFFFSGISKVNSFYLSSKGKTIKAFRRKYIIRYLLPVCLVGEIAGIMLSNKYAMLSAAILGFYFLAIEATSRGVAQGKQTKSLLGEYLVGRVLMLLALLICFKQEYINGLILLSLYGLQYLAIYCWMQFVNKEGLSGIEELEVSTRKVVKFQESDIASSVVVYSPTILQYIFNGAFETGFIGTISVARRFINFVSGPAAKVFLPEFSRLYKSGDRDGLKRSYAMIVKVQMVFVSLIGVVFIVFSGLFLGLFSPELLDYSTLFTITSACLLATASIGPVNGLLLMTGNEKKCNIVQWFSILCMVITWVGFFRISKYFIIIGLCVQSIIYSFGSYICVALWFKDNILPVGQLLILWAPIIIDKLVVMKLGLQNSWLALAASVLMILAIGIIIAVQDPMVKEALKSFKKRFVE